MKRETSESGVLVPAVDRAAQILKTVAASESALGISELSRQLGLNKSTVHDILGTLCHHQLLERDGRQKTYRLGPALAALGQKADDHTDLRTLAHPRMANLARAAGETVLLGVYHDGSITIIDQEEAPHAIKITAPVGRRLHYSAGAFGKVFLAAMTEAQVNQLMRSKPLRTYTARSVVKPSIYRGLLPHVRAQGYALDDEEYLEGVRAVAAPVVDVRGAVIAAVCVVGFCTRLPSDMLLRVARDTRAVAEQISRQVGAVEYPAWNGVG